ncbi:MAG: CHAD domain-containing protein [Alphaproteobacteria bacterium]|nr:CHAD domain-containing protein [Alphaproteobacteria bacterium]
MGYVIRPGEAQGAELERIIAGQVERLRSACMHADEDQAVFIHQARVRCKKIRAVLRLALPLVGRRFYRRENERWRDLARGLSSARDLNARLEGFEQVTREFGDTMSPSAVTRVRARFRREAGLRTVDIEAAVKEFCLELNKPRPDFPEPRRAGDGDVYAEGLARSYGAARRAMKIAYSQTDREPFHEWRKQVKHHALQVRLLRRVFPEALANRAVRVRDLAECLGRVQDTDLVIAGLSGWKGAPAGLAGALEDRRGEMIDQARILGKELFGVRKGDWMKRLAARAEPEGRA